MYDDLIRLEDGTWIKPVTPKEAFSFRCDIPMYVVYLRGPATLIERDMSVDDYRYAKQYMSLASANRYTSFWWSDYQRFVEVDVDKEEYKPVE